MEISWSRVGMLIDWPWLSAWATQLEDLVKLLGQFDTIVFARAGGKKAGSGGPVTDFVRLDEAEDIGKPIGIPAGTGADDLRRGGARSLLHFILETLTHFSQITESYESG